MADNTRRFSTRVDNYVKYRPSYPAEIVALLAAECGLSASAQIADIGSGTGILSELWLRNGNPVYGIEPNRAMREAGEQLLALYPSFTSVDGSAEGTTLPDASVDFVTAGQAFHWFDQAKARAEWNRILRPAGWVVLIWNLRREDTAFLRDYETVLQTYGTDYSQVSHRSSAMPEQRQAEMSAFFAPGGFTLYTLPNQQLFDLAGLNGRVFSSSYTPEPDHPSYAPLQNALRQLFERHQSNGQVAFKYQTEVYFGKR
ncbi:MAG: class I SAM-dependent methyltransferase [Herpetosiphonaceae bacterium]|nr:class I SAM-dependent methyltransferase [Herpetosiphonaceae bacterium]